MVMGLRREMVRAVERQHEDNTHRLLNDQKAMLEADYRRALQTAEV